MHGSMNIKIILLSTFFAFTCPQKKAGDFVSQVHATKRVVGNEGVVLARVGVSIKVVRKN